MPKRAYFLAACLAVVCLTGAAEAKERPRPLSALELQSIQSRDFEGTKDQVFGSVMSVLQDSGYRISNGDIQSGLITGTGSTKGKATFDLWWGFANTKKTPIVSAFIEQIGPITRVRLNFVMARLKTGDFGMRSEQEEPVTDANVYRDAFEKIAQALFVRQSIAAPTPPAAPAAATPPTPPTSSPSPAAGSN